MGLLDKLNKHLNDVAEEIQSKVANAAGFISPESAARPSISVNSDSEKIEELERIVGQLRDENRYLSMQLAQVKAKAADSSCNDESAAAQEEIKSLKSNIEQLKELINALQTSVKVERDLKNIYKDKITNLEEKIKRYKKEYFIVDDDD